MERTSILVVEDEKDIRELIEYRLQREGFEVSCVENGRDAIRFSREKGPDLILLDLMLPGVDGIEVCRELRKDPVTSETPIIMVTAKGEESDVILGLGIGADDYVAKPFSPKELVARVKAVLRRGARAERDSLGERVAVGDLAVDLGKHQVKVKGVEGFFTPTELKLLHFMASHPGRAFTRDKLLDVTVGHNTIVVDRNIDVHVRSIRQKLGEFRFMIETIRGVGYRFKESVEG